MNAPGEQMPGERLPDEPAAAPLTPDRRSLGQAHPTSGLDETVHQRHRLGILTITAEARSAAPAARTSA